MLLEKMIYQNHQEIKENMKKMQLDYQ